MLCSMCVALCMAAVLGGGCCAPVCTFLPTRCIRTNHCVVVLYCSLLCCLLGALNDRPQSSFGCWSWKAYYSWVGFAGAEELLGLE
jgi:hypothetical protein